MTEIAGTANLNLIIFCRYIKVSFIYFNNNIQLTSMGLALANYTATEVSFFFKINIYCSAKEVSANLEYKQIIPFGSAP